MHAKHTYSRYTNAPYFGCLIYGWHLSFSRREKNQVENVRFERRLYVPSVACYHYTTFSLARKAVPVTIRYYIVLFVFRSRKCLLSSPEEPDEGRAPSSDDYKSPASLSMLIRQIRASRRCCPVFPSLEGLYTSWCASEANWATRNRTEIRCV